MQGKSKYRRSVKLGLLKRLRLNRILVLISAILIVLIYALATIGIPKSNLFKSPPKDKFSAILNKSTPTSKPTPTPTPRPLTFAEMNALYGPCVHVAVLMYHHIQTKDAAAADKQASLTVDTDIFSMQMQYLKSKNYNVLTMNDLINFFDNGTPVPGHSVLLTFDDGYQDFYTDAYPILSSLGFHASMFVPTGLMENPDYMTWNELSGMNGLILFANHTWSHKNVQVSGTTMRSEISTADTQLADHGLNSPKVFAYPYGLSTLESEAYLESLAYKAAFTTVPGSTLCKKQRFALPRIRIGNTSLSSYGF